MFSEETKNMSIIISNTKQIANRRKSTLQFVLQSFPEFSYGLNK